jgi:sugar lactone lactonase YvrE
VVLLTSPARQAFALSTGQGASLVIGQTGFTADASATSRSGLDEPTGVAFDPSGDLWVTDYLNNRVLEFKAPVSTGEPASLAIGQPSLTSSAPADTAAGLDEPVRVTFGPSGGLWVTDYLNNRVLEYEPPFSMGEAASLVIGQPGLATDSSATTRSGLDGPDAVAFDSAGDLWVPDVVNNRVLEYTALPTASAPDYLLVVPVLLAAAAVIYLARRGRAKRSI